MPYLTSLMQILILWWSLTGSLLYFAPRAHHKPTLVIRLSPLTTPPVEKSPAMDLTLQEVLIIGNNNDQVKFSELTLDMFRILQTLEREPQEDASYQVYSLTNRGPPIVNTRKCIQKPVFKRFWFIGANGKTAETRKPSQILTLQAHAQPTSRFSRIRV